MSRSFRKIIIEGRKDSEERRCGTRFMKPKKINGLLNSCKELHDGEIARCSNGRVLCKRLSPERFRK